MPSSDQALVADVISYVKDRQISIEDPEEREEAERRLWEDLKRVFAGRRRGGVLDVLDDHYGAIRAAMYAESEN